MTEIDPAPPAPDWPDAIFAALKAAEIRQVGYVPDAGHTRLIEHCQADPEIRAVGLTSEEEDRPRGGRLARRPARRPS